MRIRLPTLALLLAAGCRGDTDVRFASSSPGLSAILIGARILTPTGETKNGGISINLESAEETYSVDLAAGETALLRVKPGVYRITPTHEILGLAKSRLRVSISGKAYRVPFPGEILRMKPVEIKPAKVASIGVIEARLPPAARGARRRVELRLDSSTATRRGLVQEMIGKMMDPKTPVEIRDGVVSWARALDTALTRLQDEEQRAPSPGEKTPQ